MQLKRKFFWLWVILLLLFLAIAMNLPPRTPPPPPSSVFLGYTNNAGQWEALFRVTPTPLRAYADGISRMDYLSTNGWTKPTAKTMSWGFSGWNGSNSIMAVPVETTNSPMRLVMFTYVRRPGFVGITDRLAMFWEQTIYRSTSLRGDCLYWTNLAVPGQ